MVQVEPCISFGELLKQMIQNSNYTNTEFYKKLKITKPYFYDIINNRINPPPPEKQFLIIEILKPDPETSFLFFNLAAKARNEIPADIAKIIIDNDLYQAIRNKQF